MECSDSETFAGLLERALRVSYDDLSTSDDPTCYLSSSKDQSENVSVPLSFNVVQCCLENGRFIRYIFPHEARE